MPSEPLTSERLEQILQEARSAQAIVDGANGSTSILRDVRDLLDDRERLEARIKELKNEIATDSWTGEMQQALGAIPLRFLGNDFWVNGIVRMAERIKSLEEALRPLARAADWLSDDQKKDNVHLCQNLRGFDPDCGPCSADAITAAELLARTQPTASETPAKGE